MEIQERKAMEMTLSGKIEKEEARNRDLKGRRAELDQRIKKSDAELEGYYLLRNSQKLIELQKAAEGTGMTVEDVISALKSGGIGALQPQQ